VRSITKRPEPNSLTRHRVTPGATYETYREKQELRDFLVAEQRGLCCYCMSRIIADSRRMKIEHWHSQSGFPNEQLDYENLLGACLGATIFPTGSETHIFEHCDTSKAESEISRNPARAAHRVQQILRYSGDGTIVSDDATFDSEINEVLHLNAAFLRNNRKAVLDAFVMAVPKAGTLSRGILQRWVNQWNGNSHNRPLEPFCMVIVYWLNKRLGRA
jgi:uncharacterized protein (TIGR02646 family)